MEDCKPCAFGSTSSAGATSDAQCVEAAQACPVGQIPVVDAVSGAQCGCLPGYGGELQGWVGNYGVGLWAAVELHK
jgi:hypothetical protein